MILSTSQAVGAALGLTDDAIAAVIRAYCPAGRQDPPRPVALVPGHGALALPAATLVFTYAASSLIRGRAATWVGTAEAIGKFLGFGRIELELAIPPIVQALQARHPLDGASALRSFFEPDETVRSMVGRLVLRLEVRRCRVPVAHIQPHAYAHPSDQAALDAIRSVPGIETLFRKMSELSVEKIMCVESLANNLQVGPEQFPQLHALFCECVEILGMPCVPELFLEVGPPNARTFGVDRPQVILSYSLPSLCSREELMFVIGHELGHIRSGHAPFQMARHFFPQLMDLIGQMTFGVGSLVGAGAEALLFDWYRKSELTCDRCGVLVCQDPRAAYSMMMKLAGAPPSLYAQMNAGAFLRQATSFDALDTSLLSKAYKLIRTTVGNLDHPWLALRARELARWIEGGGYEGLLRGTGVSANCACGATLESGVAFCSTCGRRVGPN